MKYKDLIQFESVDEIIKFDKLDNENYRERLVKTFVFSESFVKIIIPLISYELNLDATYETKGLQVVGNYGTGKSHLMSLFSIIAEDESYLKYVNNQKAKDDLQKIVKIQISSLVNRCKSLQNITLKIRPVAERWIVDKAYDPKYGARPLRRKIQTELEDLLSEKILAGDIHPGDQVTVGVKNDKLSFLINGK